MPTRKQSRDAVLQEVLPAKRAATAAAPKRTVGAAGAVSSTRAQPPTPIDEPEPIDVPTDLFMTTLRQRVDSISSDVSDDLKAIDRELAAEAAAAANAETLRKAESPAASIKEVEVDMACELIYETMEEQAMMDILGELQDEYLANDPKPLAALAKPAKKSRAPAASSSMELPPTTCAEQDAFLWNVVATPAMMRAFASTVASSTAVS